jgi:RNA-splicing ligase RtcB
MLDEVEETTEKQIRGFLEHPAFAHTYIAIMPDCHAGAGAVIGYTAKMNGYVIPNVIGLDISCGLLAVNLGKVLDLGNPHFVLKRLDEFIKKRIPSGFAHRREPPVSKYDDKVIEIIQLANKLELDVYDVLCQLGTLGGGNHFIEVNRDPEDNYWLVIHSGSRNFGLKIATYYQDKAKELMKKMFIEKEGYKNLEFLPLDMGGNEYIEAMKIAQGFASSNRKLMAKMILEGVFSLDINKVEQIESVHNYINFEDNIVRKGAIQAQIGQRVIIPLNMRDGALIGTGKGNQKWNFSAPHGAGRVLSRKKAKETLTMEEYKSEMEGIFTSCINKDTLDESPMAYKDKTLIMESIGETVDIEFQMKPVYNFKAGGD